MVRLTKEERNALILKAQEDWSAGQQWLINPAGGNSFYARTLNGCSRVIALGFGTAAVHIDRRGRYVLSYDPIWYAKLPKLLQILIQIHEAAHLILMHCERLIQFRRVNPNIEVYRRLRPILMIAADMAVNDVALRPMFQDNKAFEPFRKNLVWPEQRQYPQDKTFEEYFNMLLDDLKEHGFDPNQVPDPSGSGNNPGGPGSAPGQQQQPSESSSGSGDPEEQEDQPQRPGDKLGDDYPQWFKDILNQTHDHPEWELMLDEMTDAEIERALSRSQRDLKNMIRQAVAQTKKSRGTVPQAIQEAIDALMEDPTIPWTMILRSIVRSEISSKLEESTVMPNPAYLPLKQYGVAPYPGYQYDFSFNIVSATDTSGSVSEDEFHMFMEELLGVVRAEPGVSLRALQFDAAIQHEKIIGPEDHTELKERSYRYGGGGTSFTPAFKYIVGKDNDEDWEAGAQREIQRLKSVPDLFIILTDGYAPVESPGGPLPDYMPPCPVIWVLTPTGQEHPLMQPRVLRITR